MLLFWFIFENAFVACFHCLQGCYPGFVSFFVLYPNLYIYAFQIYLLYSFFILLPEVSLHCRDLSWKEALMGHFLEFIRPRVQQILYALLKAYQFHSLLDWAKHFVVLDALSVCTHCTFQRVPVWYLWLILI